MNKFSAQRATIAVLAAGLALLPIAASSAHAEPTIKKSAEKEKVHAWALTGKAGGHLPEGFGPWTGDPVSFELEAKASDNNPASGTFAVNHIHPDGELVGDFTGTITCLAVGGDVAVATGVISEGKVHLPDQEVQDVAGQKVSFTVQDNGKKKDTFFWQWEFVGAPINDCQGTAPVYDPQWGDFAVSGSML
ncbi:MAG: hypothetical protein HOQ05_03470 [Corynebacteriales bacterium]|nr:hypothetical protein [Mycobacteriales bacterium]